MTSFVSGDEYRPELGNVVSADIEAYPPVDLSVGYGTGNKPRTAIAVHIASSRPGGATRKPCQGLDPLHLWQQFLEQWGAKANRMAIFKLTGVDRCMEIA